jgi:multidrug efflux system membrane fusion protein
VPSQAVQVGQKGPYLYVVKDDQTVEYRPVTPGMLVNGETVIEAGLQADERVVIDGQMQLADGVKIEERTSRAPAKAEGNGTTENHGKVAEAGLSTPRGKQ